MTDTPSPGVLPFADFLAVLRDKGFDIGVREHLLLARLLERWSGTDAIEFGDSLAALIARNEVESREICRLFADTYTPRPVDEARPPAPPPPDPWRSFRAHAWLAAVAFALVLLVIALHTPPEPPPPPPPVTPITTQPPPSPGTPVQAPAPPAPDMPPTPKLVERRLAALTGAGLFLLAFGGCWALKLRDARRRWTRDAWATALAGIPGPYHFPIVLRDLAARIPRIDVEDTATVLSRAFTAIGQRQQLDVRRSLVRTLQHGRLPQFVFRPRRAMRTIVVLHDIAPEMRVWRQKIDRFVIDLQRQGVPLERWYFDGDIRRLARTPHRISTTLDALLRQRPDVAVMVVSSGSQLPALLEHDTDWMRALDEREWRTWLTPVSDARLWPAEFSRLPFAVWPMTRQGLLSAARALAEPNAVSANDVRLRERAESRVTLDGIERLKRLASLVPHPTTDLLDALRRRFAPDVSDATVLHLLRESTVSTAPVVRLSDEEIARCLTALRFESPRLEGDVRRFLLGVLKDSEPAVSSAAHLRWEIAVALHRRALADLGDGDRREAEAALTRYANGPMWEEVRQLTKLLPASPGGERHVAFDRGEPSTLVHASRAGTPPHSAPSSGAPMRWIWPGGRELVPAIAATFVLLLAFWSFSVLPVRAVEHVTGAYGLTYTPPSTANRYGTLEVTTSEGTSSTSPTVVDVYKGEVTYKTALALSAGKAMIPLDTAADLGAQYQVRARLPRGNLALSNWAWVPGRQVTVLIDAQPWARVTLTGTRVPAQPQTTPFVALLDPGRYTLHLENDGLTSASDQTITVNEPSVAGTPATQTFRFTMPGFDPDRTAQTLTAAPARAK